MNGKAVDARQDDDMHGRVTSEVGVAERRSRDFRRGRQEFLCFRATCYHAFIMLACILACIELGFLRFALWHRICIFQRACVECRFCRVCILALSCVVVYRGWEGMEWRRSWRWYSTGGGVEKWKRSDESRVLTCVLPDFPSSGASNMLNIRDLEAVPGTKPRHNEVLLPVTPTFCIPRAIRKI
jgi:hypothetical protein